MESQPIRFDTGEWRGSLPMHSTKFLVVTAAASLVGLATIAHSTPASEPTVAGLWQKTDQDTGNDQEIDLRHFEPAENRRAENNDQYQ